eukprot:8442515-Pyramimonas_sp.AAC.1
MPSSTARRSGHFGGESRSPTSPGKFSCRSLTHPVYCTAWARRGRRSGSPSSTSTALGAASAGMKG